MKQLEKLPESRNVAELSSEAGSGAWDRCRGRYSCRGRSLRGRGKLSSGATVTGVADILIGAPGTGSGSMGRFQSVAGARNATRKAAGCRNTARNAAGARLGGKTFLRRYGDQGR